MNPTKGYYSLVQFCPDLSRLEAVNVGVVLFVPDRAYLQVRMSAGNDRVRRFFGKEAIDATHLQALKASVEERLRAEAGRFTQLEDLQGFIATRGNQLQLTEPRFVKVTNPDEELERLYRLLVGGRQMNIEQPAVRRELGAVLRSAGLCRKIVQDVVVPVPAFQESLRVPFGFQNGRFNLLQPVRFSGLQKEGVITRACRYAVEGESVYSARHHRFGDLELWLVARFAAHQREEQATVRSILRGKPVQLFTTEQLPRLVDIIRETGHDIDTSSSLPDHSGQ